MAVVATTTAAEVKVLAIMGKVAMLREVDVPHRAKTTKAATTVVVKMATTATTRSRLSSRRSARVQRHL